MTVFECVLVTVLVMKGQHPTILILDLPENVKNLKGVEYCALMLKVQSRRMVTIFGSADVVAYVIVRRLCLG